MHALRSGVLSGGSCHKWPAPSPGKFPLKSEVGAAELVVLSQVLLPLSQALQALAHQVFGSLGVCVPPPNLAQCRAPPSAGPPAATPGAVPPPGRAGRWPRRIEPATARAWQRARCIPLQPRFSSNRKNPFPAAGKRGQDKISRVSAGENQGHAPSARPMLSASASELQIIDLDARLANEVGDDIHDSLYHR